MKIKTLFLILSALLLSFSGFSKECIKDSQKEDKKACEIGNDSVLVAQITDQGILKVIPKAIRFANDFTKKISDTGKITKNCEEVDAQIKIPDFTISSENLCIKKMQNFLPIDALNYSCGSSTIRNKDCTAPSTICKKVCSSPKTIESYLEYLNTKKTKKRVKKKEKKENKLSIITELCPSFPEGVEEYILNEKYQNSLLHLLDFDKMNIKKPGKIAREIFMGLKIKQAINAKRGLKVLAEVKNLNNRLVPFEVKLENLVVDTPQNISITLHDDQPKNGVKVCASLEVPLSGDIKISSHNGNSFDDNIFQNFNYQKIGMNIKIKKEEPLCFSSTLNNGKVDNIKIINLESTIKSISRFENKLFSIDFKSIESTDTGKSLFLNFIHPILNKALFSKVNETNQTEEESLISKAIPVKKINEIVQNKINEATKKLIPTISKLSEDVSIPKLPVDRLQNYLDQDTESTATLTTLQNKITISENLSLPVLTSGLGNFCSDKTLKEQLDFNCNSDLKVAIDLQNLENTLSKLNKEHNFFDLCLNMKINQHKTLDLKSYCKRIEDSKNATSCEMSDGESFAINLNEENEISLTSPTLNCKTLNYVVPSRENGLLEVKGQGVGGSNNSSTKIDGLINIETFKVKPTFKVSLSLINNNISLDLKEVSGTHSDNGGLTAIINRELGKLMKLPLEQDAPVEKALSPLNQTIEDKNQYIDFLQVKEENRSLQICANIKAGILNE